MGSSKYRKEDIDSDYAKAQKRVQRKKGFQKHFSIYLVVSAFLYLINQLTSPHELWFYWPMLGWGIGIAIQYSQLYGIPGIIDPVDEDWERREMEAELRKIKAAKGESFVADKPIEKPVEKLDLKTLDPLKQKETRWDENELV
jgi:2TM domain